MFDIHDRPESVFMILELMRGGDMISRISKMPQRRLPESSAKFFFIQMAEAMKYLHDKGITHRDIKPDNILLATEDEETLLKVTDFGLSKFVKKNSIMKTLCGTPQYVAPEILTTRGKGSYTKKVDIWSMGCCLYACLAGSVPFTGGEHGDVQHIANDIVRGSLRFDPVRWQSVSQSAVSMVTKCLTKNPAKRPSIEDLRAHRWLNDEAVIKRVERIMGQPVLVYEREQRRQEQQPQPRRNDGMMMTQMENQQQQQQQVVTNRVRVTTARPLFLLPEMRHQRINNTRGSTPPVQIGTVPTTNQTAQRQVIMTTAPVRECLDQQPPLKRSRMGP